MNYEGWGVMSRVSDLLDERGMVEKRTPSVGCQGTMTLDLVRSAREDSWQSSLCSLLVVVCTEMLKEGNVAAVALCGRGMVDKDPPLVSRAMSLHSLQDREPRQKHPMPPAAVVDEPSSSPARIDYELDLTGQSYAYSAILHCLDLTERLLGTMDDGTANAEAETQAPSRDQSA
jgi:hypothetical protein